LTEACPRRNASGVLRGALELALLAAVVLLLEQVAGPSLAWSAALAAGFAIAAVARISVRVRRPARPPGQRDR
jgi:hypothetical protein